MYSIILRPSVAVLGPRYGPKFLIKLSLSLSLSLSPVKCVCLRCVCVSRSRLQYCSMLICHGSESESCVCISSISSPAELN